jgi:hypothetical protein
MPPVENFVEGFGWGERSRRLRGVSAVGDIARRAAREWIDRAGECVNG